MQVLLREDVEKLGRRGEIVSVKDGYARNYLLPQGMAMAVREGELKAIEMEKKRLDKLAERERRELSSLRDKLVQSSVTISAKANEEGHLFGSVGPAEISEALTREVAAVGPEMIRLETHIKELGVYDVPVRLSADFEATVKVWVVGEQAPEEPQAKVE